MPSAAPSALSTPPEHHTAVQVIHALAERADPVKAAFFPSFFKTGKGEYGEGDIFLGITVPAQREVAKQSVDLPLTHVKKLLDSKIHEHRLTGLLILDYKVLRAVKQKDTATHTTIVDFYLANRARVNNWDLVDASARQIVGEWLVNRPPHEWNMIYDYARSHTMWERRIAVLISFSFLACNNFAPSLRLAKMLLSDKHDLMHKATGWMLREVGKRDETVLRAFLDAHAHEMPRTMLRYSIEKFDEKTRKRYLSMKI